MHSVLSSANFRIKIHFIFGLPIKVFWSRHPYWIFCICFYIIIMRQTSVVFVNSSKTNISDFYSMSLDQYIYYFVLLKLLFRELFWSIFFNGNKTKFNPFFPRRFVGCLPTFSRGYLFVLDLLYSIAFYIKKKIF